MISSDHARTSVTGLFQASESRPVKQYAEIAGVRAAALCWLVVLKSTRALKRIEVERADRVQPTFLAAGSESWLR